MGKTPWDFCFYRPWRYCPPPHTESQRTRIPVPSEVVTASGVLSTVGIVTDAPDLLPRSL